MTRSPATQSELADRVNTSIQNVDYHLENLPAAGLVEVVDAGSGRPSDCVNRSHPDAKSAARSPLCIFHD